MSLKQLREKAGLRIMDVAVALGVTESSVRNWEHGRSVPRLEQARMLLKLYDCSFDELCDAVAAASQRKEASALRNDSSVPSQMR